MRAQSAPRARARFCLGGDWGHSEEPGFLQAGSPARRWGGGSGPQVKPREAKGKPAERIQGVPVPEELGLGCPHWATSTQGGRASGRAGAKVSPSPRFISRQGPRAV